MPKRLYDEDGSDAGEASYAAPIRPGNVIWTPDNIEVRVLEMLPIEDEESPFAGALRVECV
jgi:hypothetical protein